jgi:diguanylate cyclase (GGDEF)-like protein/PAS domain S-box-containing protein
MSLLLSLTIILSTIYSIVKSRELSEYWFSYSNEISVVSGHLNQIERDLGYGGFIHNFKDLVIRSDQAYFEQAKNALDRVESNLLSLTLLCKKIEQEKVISDDLDSLTKTMNLYREMLSKLNTQDKRIKPIMDIDKIVMVNDDSAIAAINNINHTLSELRNLHKIQINEIGVKLTFATRFLLVSIPFALLSVIGILVFSSRIEKLKRQYESLFQHSPNSMIEVDESGLIVNINRQTSVLFLHSKEELIGKKIEYLVPRHERQHHKKRRKEYISTPTEQYKMMGSRQVYGQRKDGTQFPAEVSLSTIEVSQQHKHVIADVFDISDKFELKQQAQYDHLTRLSNRFSFEKQIEELIVSSHTNHRVFSLIMIDIDHFKEVNDEFGHLFGDEVLMKFADQLHKTARKIDLVCRWGGEEFVILVPDLDEQDLYATCERIRSIIENTPFIEGRPITCSIGATVFRHNDSLHDIMKRADLALYNVKNKGRNHCHIYPLDKQ